MGNSFNKLEQLRLLEDFKKCVPTTIKTYLEEQKVNELQREVSLADKYKLTHKSSTTPESQPTKEGGNVDSTQPDQKRTSNIWFRPTCGNYRQWNHLMYECWALQKKEKKNPTANPVATISNASSSTNSFLFLGKTAITLSSPVDLYQFRQMIHNL